MSVIKSMSRTDTVSKSPRAVAVRVLERARRSGAWSDAALSSETAKAGLDRLDSALAGQLCYGVLQQRSLLDFYIDYYCSTKSARLEPKLLDILRVSAYQIIFLDRIPDFSAVNEGVALCKSMGLQRASGLCNAVLRRISENKESLPAVPGRGTAKHLAIRYSHPEWFVSEMIESIGYDATTALLIANNSPVPITAQVNTLKITTDKLQESLSEKGITAQKHPWMPDCLLLRGTGAVQELSEFRDGLFYVQDTAARLAVMASGVRPGMKVLDCCAAPGGKSFAASIIMNNEGSLTSCDIHGKKLSRIEQGAQRLGIDIISTCECDARHPLSEFESAFDVVIADVPCSGFGVIRKKPEIRYKSREDVAGLPEIQLDIIRSAAGGVKPGGTLIYSTCTVLKSENQDVINKFLSENNEFEPQSYKLPVPVERPVDGMISFWPYVYDCDGFFICRLGRKK